MNHDANANDPCVLVSVSNDLEASVIVGALADRSIHATTTGDYTSSFRAEAPGQVSVVVRQADVQRAREELAKIRAEHDQIDWSNVDCGDGDAEHDGQDDVD